VKTEKSKGSRCFNLRWVPTVFMYMYWLDSDEI